MAEKSSDNPFGYSPEDMEKLYEIMANAAQQSAQMMTTYVREVEQQQSDLADPLQLSEQLSETFMTFTSQMLNNPAKLVEHQMALFDDYAKLWTYTSRKQAGESADPVIEAGSDKRFKSIEWSDNSTFDFIKQAYLLLSKHIFGTVADMQGLDSKEREKFTFYTQQMMDALSPSNFIMTNPDVIKATIDSKGENLVRGMQNMLADINDSGDSLPLISMVDKKQFAVGENVATTPGQVVFRNDLIELIQYSPTTDEVKKTPLLVFPPWINKYYILDLNEKKSLMRWLVAEGYTTFMVSWVNPNADHRDKGLEAYLQEGYLEALKVVQEITGEKSIHTAGYCVGGTMLTVMLAYLHGKGKGDRVKSATFFTTLTNFDDAGELMVFVDREQVEAIKTTMATKGYMDGKTMALSFNMLRSNDLIWSYLINNYLLGKDPMAFDLLYWNSDSTNQAEACHGEYLEQMYLHNLLNKPGGMTLSGVDIDLSQIDTPMYVLATKDDHIAPAHSVYALRNIGKGPVKFVLGGSGHIAGVVNPPGADGSAGKYHYWTTTDKADTLADFMETADQYEGSWWPDWSSWLARRSKTTVQPRIPGDGPHPALEPAPGSYVKVRI